MTISVCIVSYNQARYLPKALDSVVAQTFPPDQIVVVDDGSTDGSRALLSSFAERHPRRVCLVLSPDNTGVACARSEALRRVTSEYVTFLDADDWFAPDKLRLEFAALAASPDAQFVFSDICYTDADGRALCKWAGDSAPPEGDVFPEVYCRSFPKGNLFRSELVNVAAWRAVGDYDLQLSLYEDFDMRIRLTHALRGRFVNAVLNHYRLHEAGLSRTDFVHHYAALRYIGRKNRPLLDDRNASDRTRAHDGFEKLLSGMAMRAARQNLRNGKLGAAALLALHGAGHTLGRAVRRTSEALSTRDAER